MTPTMHPLFKSIKDWLIEQLTGKPPALAPARATAAPDHIGHDHAQSIVPFDENLLERSRTQWQFGDWDSLAKLDRDTLQHHPDRAKLALFAAAGQLQSNNAPSAQQFIRLALDWGCSKKMVSQVLVSGVYSTLGTVAIAGGDRQRALGHFKAAASVGNQKTNSTLLAETQAMRETLRLGQLQQQAVASLVAMQHPTLPTPAKPDVGIVSYAQNFEDVMLWRALGRVENGFYIDVGAFHPIHDSVSKGFYERGWRGIHIEANPAFAALIKQDRPDEVVLNVALAASQGHLMFNVFEDIPGESTGNQLYARSRMAEGVEMRTFEVPCCTLSDVFAQVNDREIHWLKIDVERMEAEVLSGWGQSGARPWIVVVESVLPHTTIENNTEWEHLLNERGYNNVYFDGLNRFYVSSNHSELSGAFLSGPNIFDGFMLNGTGGGYSELIKARQREEIANLQKEISVLKSTVINNP